jgi:hypothetical protein
MAASSGFQKDPQELRDKIWSFARPSPSAIELYSPPSKARSVPSILHFSGESRRQYLGQGGNREHLYYKRFEANVDGYRPPLELYFSPEVDTLVVKSLHEPRFSRKPLLLHLPTKS